MILTQAANVQRGPHEISAISRPKIKKNNNQRRNSKTGVFAAFFTPIRSKQWIKSVRLFFRTFHGLLNIPGSKKTDLVFVGSITAAVF
jgi:hypothetical protein